MRSEKIAIIGAGLAGLTMAYRLWQKGYEVAIFEARPRVGGRIHTVFVENLEGGRSHAELGGQNISDGGEAKNIRSLIKELDLEILEDDIEFNGLYFDGENFYDRRAVFSEIKHRKLDHLGSSMQDVLDHLYKQDCVPKRILTFMLNAYEGLPPKLLSAQPHNLQTLEYMLSGGLSHAHVDSTQAVIHRASLKGGNAMLPIKLAEKLTPYLYLEKVLKKVTHVSESEIQLSFADETMVTCNKLILAIPCTVFNDIIFDEKVLNLAALKNIQAVHYGKNSKILVPMHAENAEQNWVFTDDMGAFFNDDKKLLNLFTINHLDFKEALNILNKGFKGATFNTHPPIDANDLNYAVYQTSVMKSWANDPYAKGSYSAYDVFLQDKIDQKVNYKGIPVKQFFAPIDDRIFFVGEHATILDEIGTMEAAVESAERIAKLL